MIEIEVHSPQRASVSGRFDASQVTAANEAFDQLGDGDVTLDFEGLAYISSAGISSLILLYRRISDAGHQVLIQNASGHVRNIFAVSGLTQLFPMD